MATRTDAPRGLAGDTDNPNAATAGCLFATLLSIPLWYLLIVYAWPWLRDVVGIAWYLLTR